MQPETEEALRQVLDALIDGRVYVWSEPHGQGFTHTIVVEPKR